MTSILRLAVVSGRAQSQGAVRLAACSSRHFSCTVPAYSSPLLISSASHRLVAQRRPTLAATRPYLTGLPSAFIASMGNNVARRSYTNLFKNALTAAVAAGDVKPGHNSSSRSSSRSTKKGSSSRRISSSSSNGGGGVGGGGGVNTSSSSNVTTLVEERHMGWSQEQMYSVVQDVNAYKDFLPWILDSRVTARSPQGCTADLEIGFAAIRERYTSHVRMQPPHTITAVSHDSRLFKLLQNHWAIAEAAPTEDGRATCQVRCAVAFEFQNPMHQVLAAAAFDKLVRQMIVGFEERCTDLHGPSAIVVPSQPPQSRPHQARSGGDAGGMATVPDSSTATATISAASTHTDGETSTTAKTRRA
eukprot:UC1_evm4s1770